MAAYTFPVTSDERAKVFVLSMINPNPVMYVAAAGLTPMFPTIDVVPVLEMPAFVRMMKLPAVRRFTGVRPVRGLDALLSSSAADGAGASSDVSLGEQAADTPTRTDAANHKEDDDFECL